MRATLRWTLLGGALAWSCLLVWGAFVPAPHNGGDNAAYLSVAHALMVGDGYVDAYDPLRAPHTKYPPFFPLVLAGMMMLGAASWVAFKLVAAVATALTVGTVFLWAERRSDPWTGLAVAMVFAASTAVVYHSHWVLSDPVFALLTMAALLALERAETRGFDRRWLWFGIVAALAAYFTRSAGLPLLVAILAWLALRRRFRTLGWTALAFGVPLLLWWLRGRVSGVGDYAAEFWLLDPYAPGLGTVGVGGLFARAAGNAASYAFRHLPMAVVGPGGAWTIGLGAVVLGGAVWGWARRVRARPGAAELFVPLYLGLILLWPEVWGGDRFLLPLLPLLLFYGAEAVQAATRRLGSGVRVVAGVTVTLGLLVPALGHWVGSARDARSCAAVVEASGAWACYGPRVTEFITAAEWSGRALPSGAAVLSRKPRIFYVMSGGVPSRTFPFDPTPDALLAEADAVGARYVLLDRWDGQAARYVGSAVVGRPGAFCFVEAFGSGQGGGVQLLGILPPEARVSGAPQGAEGVTLARCGPEYVDAGAADVPRQASSSSAIPLLSRPSP